MAKIRIPQEDIQALKFKVDNAYKMLKRAVITPAPGVLSTAQSLYQHDIGDYLLRLIHPTKHPDFLNKGGARAREIEEFILQWVLMVELSTKKRDSYKIMVTENPNDKMGGLKAYIGAEDRRDSAEGEVFRLIARKATELRAAGRYDLILNALDYVRQKYSSSHRHA